MIGEPPSSEGGFHNTVAELMKMSAMVGASGAPGSSENERGIIQHEVW